MYIMRIIAVCKDDASGIGPHIVCEYCPGEDIMTYLLDCPGGARRFSEDEVQHFFWCVLAVTARVNLLMD